MLIRFVCGLIASAMLGLGGLAVADGDGYSLQDFATELSHPWSLAFLPDGRILLTELSGNMRIIDANGVAGPDLEGVPEVVFGGQGGLSDVILDPGFVFNNKFYISYSARDPEQNNAVTLFVSSATLEETSINDLKVIFVAQAPRRTPVHFGAKMTFMPDGTMLIASGDGFGFREEAQNLGNHFGKIVRIRPDGSIPRDNPFVNTPGALPDIWSYGHRNQQALLVTRDGTVYEHEHGPRGGDELNIIRKGANYGWPVICYCLDYSFSIITPFTHMEGMEQPEKYWRPSIAPSGMAYYTGWKFPQWHNSFFVTGLVPGDVRRVTETNSGFDEEILFAEIGQRVRNIYQTPDDQLMILTDGPSGSLIKVVPTH